MHTEFLMGNEAIALGAIAAGVNLVAGYPGTPSTEVLETIAKNNNGTIQVQWSTNEKVGMEVPAGAAYSGARTMVTMKQVGLNVASDPLMSLAYIGVKGGMVVVVADDPGPISSQTEQDTRHFSEFAKLPCFDPCSAQEAYEMVQDAFDYSEKYQTPVFFRPTTRVCHGYASICVKDADEYTVHHADGFIKDSSRWVIFPRLSYNNHIKIEARNVELSEDFSSYTRNEILMPSEQNQGLRKAIATHGFSYSCVKEAFYTVGAVKLLKIATPHPFPEKLALEFLKDVDEVLCIEELDPVIEKALTLISGKHHLNVRIYGKLSHHVKNAGENTVDSITTDIQSFLGTATSDKNKPSDAPDLPIRPPVLCAGCPHRASFYAVKKAMQGKKAVFCGDIGCYTLGNAMPLDMVDTCLCMGAGIGIAQGIGKIEPDTTCFAFVGDSTFFASAITGVINAVYNESDMILIVLDNSTTAMTGHQPHPGTGHTMMGNTVDKISIEAILRGIGLQMVETVDPLELDQSVDCIQRAAAAPGVKAVIFKSPCIALSKESKPAMAIDSNKCIQCKKCISQLGCPAISIADSKVTIDSGLCNGCKLCAKVCPTGAIGGGDDDE